MASRNASMTPCRLLSSASSRATQTHAGSGQAATGTRHPPTGPTLPANTWVACHPFRKRLLAFPLKPAHTPASPCPSGAPHKLLLQGAPAARSSWSTPRFFHQFCGPLHLDSGLQQYDLQAKLQLHNHQHVGRRLLSRRCLEGPSVDTDTVYAILGCILPHNKVCIRLLPTTCFPCHGFIDGNDGNAITNSLMQGRL